ERQDERIGPVRHPDRVRHPEERGRLFFEGFDLRPEDEGPGLENRREALLELGYERRVLGLHVDQRDGLVHAGECSFGWDDGSFVKRRATPGRSAAGGGADTSTRATQRQRRLRRPRGSRRT